MRFIFAEDSSTLPGNIISLVLIVLFFGLLIYGAFKVCRRKAVFISTGVCAGLFIFAFLFELLYLAIIVACSYIAFATVCMFANLGDLRMFIGNPFKRTTAKVANFGVEKIFNKDDLYKKLETAVVALSKARIGALITFEKNTSLKDIIKNGIPVNAPVTPELLQTIFYPGTRLHDGAVVIHGNEIIAASVFFTPTTKPFAGKYGSRHRAAIGISEISDAVTVIVSEETGRISIAVNGQLDSVDQTNFLRAFETYMADSSLSNEE